MKTSSSPTRTRRSLVLAGAVVASLGLSAPAMAQGYSHADPVGDLVSSSMSTTTSGGTTTDVTKDPAPDPSARNGDINALSVRYDRHRVVVNIGMVEFNAQPSTTTESGSTDQIAGVGALIQTKSPRKMFGASGLYDGVHAQWTLFGGRHRIKAIRCKGFTHTLGADHTVTMSIPRRCLSNPRSLRVSAGSFVATESESATSMSETDWQDDAQQAGEADTETLAWGPWLRRG